LGAVRRYAGGPVKLRDEEFDLISQLVYRTFGIHLTDKKKALVQGRLNSLVRSLGFPTFEAYYNSVLRDPTGGSLLALVDRISTNYTYFFRETAHFDFLNQTGLPEICQSAEKTGRRELRMWSAGSATGEEAYSLAMVLREYLGSAYSRWDVGVLGTDISLTALRQARQGVYPAEKIGKVPLRYKKYLYRDTDGSYAVRDELKGMVLFKKLNLMQDSYPFKGKFHAVFCRNVMIYFDLETRKRLIERFHRYLHPGGFLFIGHAESLGRSHGLFEYVQPTVYRKC
jgi:chemotaxis protein methyltransferase CheR